MSVKERESSELPGLLRVHGRMAMEERFKSSVLSWLVRPVVPYRQTYFKDVQSKQGQAK